MPKLDNDSIHLGYTFKPSLTLLCSVLVRQLDGNIPLDTVHLRKAPAIAL